MRILVALAFLCMLAGTASAGKKVAFTPWTPPEKCIVDRGGVDEEGDNNAGLSRRVLDASNVADFLPNCDTGINFKKYRLVRIQMISNYRTLKEVVSAQVKKGKIVVESSTDPNCRHDVYRRSLLWVLIPKGKMRVQAVQAPIPEGEGGCPT